VSEGGTRETVRRLYDAYARRDFDQIAAAIHDDIDWVIYSPVSVFPFAGQRQGRAAVMSDVSFTQRATKRILRFRVANFLRFQDGKLIEFREFANSFDVVEQALGRELDI
jgi:ketosteroid isomerase-like protein